MFAGTIGIIRITYLRVKNTILFVLTKNFMTIIKTIKESLKRTKKLNAGREVTFLELRAIEFYRCQ